MNVRPAAARDLPALLALEHSSPTAAGWSAAEYERLLLAPAPGRVALAAEEEGAVVAFLVAREVEGEWELENLAVEPGARRRGVGSRLLAAFLELARSRGARAIHLEVRESNRAARAFYEKWGFLPSGRRPTYYAQPPEDALIYSISFPPGRGGPALPENG
jgi:ribosomal-protein-alanine N-acetyltransferase